MQSTILRFSFVLDSHLKSNYNDEELAHVTLALSMAGIMPCYTHDGARIIDPGIGVFLPRVCDTITVFRIGRK